MSLKRRQVLQLSALGVLMPAAPRLAGAEDYPEKPVRLVVPAPPGGTFDIVARLISAAVSPRLHQQIVVDNRGGAGTNLGTGFVAHAAPDGYTLLLAGSPDAINATLYTNLDFSFARDIAPVAGIERAPLIMTVNRALPASTVRDFVVYAKAKPASVNMGSGGIGSTGHVAGELFNMMAGTTLTHVPYRGEAPAVADLLAGQVQVVFSTPGSVMSAIRAGMLRPLGVTGAARMEVLPQVPTIAETLPGYEAVSWSGIGAPAHTAAAIIDTLNRQTNAALADPKLKARLATFAATVMPGTPAAFGSFIASEIDKWAKVIHFAHIKAA